VNAEAVPVAGSVLGPHFELAELGHMILQTGGCDDVDRPGLYLFPFPIISNSSFSVPFDVLARSFPDFHDQPSREVLFSHYVLGTFSVPVRLFR